MKIACPVCLASGDEIDFDLSFFGECSCPLCHAGFEVDFEDDEDFDPTDVEYSR